MIDEARGNDAPSETGSHVRELRREERELVDLIRKEISELRALPTELRVENAERQVRLEADVASLREDVAEAIGAIKDIDTMLRGDGERKKGIVGRLNTIEAGANITVAKIRTAGTVRVALIAASAGFVASIPGAIIAWIAANAH